MTEWEVTALRSAARVFQRRSDSRLEAKTRHTLGLRLAELGRDEEAVHELARCIHLWNALGDTLSAAKAEAACGAALVHQGREEESLPYLERAAETFDAAHDSLHLVATEEVRVQALVALGKWEHMQPHITRILKNTEGNVEAPCRRARLTAFYHGARLLVRRKQVLPAAAYAEHAADLAHEFEELEAEAHMTLIVATGCAANHDYTSAVQAYERLLRISREVGRHDWELEAISGLGTVLEQEPAAGAVRLLEMADAYAASGATALEAMSRYRAGRCLESAPGDTSLTSAVQYESAAGLFEALAMAPETAESYYRAGYSYSWAGLLHEQHREKSFALCQRAASGFEALDNWWGKALAEDACAMSLLKNHPGDPEDPRKVPMLQRSARSFGRAHRHMAAATARLSAAVHMPREPARSWIREGVRALLRYERARPYEVMPHHREWSDRQFSQGLMALLSMVVDAAPQRKSDPWWRELLWRLEQAVKSRSFQDEWNDSAWRSIFDEDAQLRELTGAIEVARVHLDQCHAALSTALIARMEDAALRAAATRDRLEEELKALETRLNDRYEAVARERSDIRTLVGIPCRTPAEIQACLNEGEAFLGFLWGGWGLCRVLVRPQSCAINISPGEAWLHEWLTSAVTRARHGYTDNGWPEENELLRRVAAVLLGEIPSDIDTLLISPHGPMVGLPWHELPLAGEDSEWDSVEDRYTISVVPAAGFLHSLRRDHPEVEVSTRRLAYLGVACDGGSYQRLEVADRTVEQIATNYFSCGVDSAYLTTKECGALLNQTGRVGLLHLACHAEPSGLLLSEDGTWTTPVSLLGMSLRADILLLMACRAGDLSRREASEFPGKNEFLGIVRQLLIVCQARAAVISVAAVPEAAGVVFSELLVSALTGRNDGRPWPIPDRPLSAGESVRWARYQLSELGPEHVEPLVPAGALLRPEHPSWWAPWFLLGDPRARLET
jgi:tetratricopeptide (TPR) repeat protein